MSILRKSLKAYAFVFMMFIIMSFAVAALIKFTCFREEWGHMAMIAVLAIMCFLIGYLEGSIVGRRGLVIGIASQVVFLFVIVAVLSIAFAQPFSIGSSRLLLPLQIFAGAAGGIVGANSGKSQ